MYSTFKVRRAVKGDKEEILQCLKKCFFPHNPLANYLKITNSKGYEEYTMRCMENPSYNFVAILDNKIVGVCMNREVTRENYLLPKSERGEMEIANKFWFYVLKNADLFAKFPEEKQAFLIQIVGVDPDVRRDGVAKILVLEAMLLAKKMGYTLLTADCVSSFSAQGFKKFGFDTIYKLKYEDFKINNETIIKSIIPPHECVEIIAMKIDSSTFLSHL